jgi:hypothetical protein
MIPGAAVRGSAVGMRKLPRHVRVVAPDGAHQEDEERDRAHHDPSPAEEFRGDDDEEHDTGDGRTEAIDERAMRRARFGGSTPVDDHARLRERERYEHTHQIQLDQTVEISVEDHDERGREDRQDDHAVGEDEPIPPVHELARHEPVLGEDRDEPREVLVRGIGGKDEDAGGHGL